MFHPSLTDLVARAFAPDGPLARAQPHFRPRPGQLAMAQAVAQAMGDHARLVVEAGTGVGKTFAYLVPALLSGQRVLICTATKALQDQLHGRDLPQLLRALALPQRTALLKGRASYLCRQRLQLARQALATAHAAQLADIQLWAQGTQTGDLAELPGLDERSPVLALVTSTHDNCLGQGCPHFADCHVYQARRQALAADVLVINHHLFFADLAVRESGVARLLPDTGVVVFDEAHQLAETASQFLGQQLGTGQLHDLAQDLLAVGLRHAPALADWPAHGERLRQAARQWRLLAPEQAAAAPPGRLPWAGVAPAGWDATSWAGATAGAVLALRSCLAALDAVAHLAPDLAHLHQRTVDLLAHLARFSAPPDAGCVRWLDMAGQLRLREVPLDVGPALRALWQGLPAEPGAWDEPARPPAAPARGWVFTSATLGDDERLRWFTAACGIDEARVLRVDSPFDYAHQAALYVPRQLPEATDPAHSEQLAHWVADAALRLGGRTLVLTTSLRALQELAGVLGRRLAPGCGVELLVQGQAPKRRIMERFRAPPHATGYVLLGSASFWEGFDVPGSALQLLVIDRLPFPSPGDPLVQAHGARLKQQGRSAFRDYALPAAAVALKQGAGRLIRSEDDRGVLVVADQRLLRMGYGKRLLRALPAMRRLESEAEFAAALAALTRTSTTGSPWP
ncbi:MAG: ATP-dependent DNA helicase [Proteobacteria bacterium]|nr:ATP-dependent DNA helicase [Pseudomonadota bacterium]